MIRGKNWGNFWDSAAQPRTGRSQVAIIASALIVCAGCGGGGGGGVSATDQVVRTSTLTATGFGANGAPLLSGGDSDANWTIVVNDRHIGSAVLLTPVGPNWFDEWFPNTATSQWIGTANVSSPGPAPYSYELKFDIGNFDPELTEITGRWGIDDDGTLEVNGVRIAELNRANETLSPNWVSLNEFTVPASAHLLHTGVNTITMTLRETDNYLEGARLEAQLNEHAAED